MMERNKLIIHFSSLKKMLFKASTLPLWSSFIHGCLRFRNSSVRLPGSGLLLVQKKRANIENVCDSQEKDTFLKAFFGQKPKTEFDFLKLVQGFPISLRKSNSMLAKKTSLLPSYFLESRLSVLNHKLYFALFFICNFSFAQSTLSLDEYLMLVKQNHPYIKQADLKLTEAQAKLLKSRGNFDPKIVVDQDQKEFKDKTYYKEFSGKLKVPTYYGIELEAGFENNSGEYLNPRDNTPDDGLYSLGISMSLLQDFIINPRQTMLKQAKLYEQQTGYKRDLMVNEVLYKAISTYINWSYESTQLQLKARYVENALWKHQNVVAKVVSGDAAAIDSVESLALLSKRQLELEEGRLNLKKAELKTSNYLWTADAKPLEIQDSVFPNDFEALISQLSEVSTLNNGIENHPKLLAEQLSIDMLSLDYRLYKNKLLPDLKLKYNVLSDQTNVQDLKTSDYKFGFQFEMPLFLRKDRGALQLSRAKLRTQEYKVDQLSLELANELKVVDESLKAYQKQRQIAQGYVNQYSLLLDAESKRFEMGESSLFRFNQREKSLLEAEVKQISIQNKLTLGLLKRLKWYVELGNV
jgi:outer membrane protein TolC